MCSDIQHNVIQNNGLNCDIQHYDTRYMHEVSLYGLSDFLIVRLNVIMLSVVMLYSRGAVRPIINLSVPEVNLNR
jgi:hypothetical protein